jgi:hypothetical protein
MALRRLQMPEEGDPIDQLEPYMSLIVYEYALRREAGLEPKEAVRWSLRRVLPPPDGLHPVLAMIAGYKVAPGVWDAQASALLRGLISTGDKNWHGLRGVEGWRPGSVGMGW